MRIDRSDCLNRRDRLERRSLARRTGMPTAALRHSSSVSSTSSRRGRRARPAVPCCKRTMHAASARSMLQAHDACSSTLAQRACCACLLLAKVPSLMLKRRFCFALDNVLVTAPAKGDDFSTCLPIDKNIQLVRPSVPCESPPSFSSHLPFEPHPCSSPPSISSCQKRGVSGEIIDHRCGWVGA